MRRLLPKLFASAVAAAFATGCAAGGRGPAQRCSNDDQCPAGQVCFDSVCGDPYDLAVHVRPAGGGVPEAQFGQVDTRGSKMKLVIPPAALIQGTLQVGEPANYARFTGAFRLHLEGESPAIPTLHYRQDVDVAAGGAPPGDFHFQAPAGRYRISAFPIILPGDPPLAPVWSRFTADAGKSVDPGLAFYPEPSLLRVTGTVDPGLTPISSLSIQAFRDEFPLSQPAQLSSAFFSLLVSPPAYLPLELRVFGGDPTLPTWVQVLPALPPSGLSVPVSLGSVGAPAPFAFTAPPGASVTFVGPVGQSGTSATASFSAGPIAVDASGHGSAQLLASAPGGAYSAIIRTPPGPGSADCRVTGVTVPAAATPALACPARTQASGRTAFGDGSPAADVLVKAEPYAAPGTPIGEQQGAETTTDAAGSYSLPLDPGEYRFSFIPPPAAGLPRGSRRFVIGASATASLEAVTLSTPRVVSGTLLALDPSGAEIPVSGAVVTVYHVSPEKQDATILAEAVCGAAGDFKVILPDTSR